MSVNFHKAIKPMLITSKIFGVVSFNFGKNEYKVSKINIYIKTILAVGYFMLIGYAMSYQDVLFPLIIKTTDSIQLTVTTVLVTTAWLCGAWYQKKSIQILLKLLKFDNDMRKLGVWMSYDKLNCMIYIQIMTRFILNVLLICSFLVTIVLVTDKIGFELLFQPPIIFNSVICHEIAIYVSILRYRFGILNKHLTTLNCNQGGLLSDRIRVIKLKTFCGTKLKMLRVVCSLHHELTKISEIINERYGIILLMSFLHTFINTVVDIYFCSTFRQNSNILMIVTSVLLHCSNFVVESFYICYLCNSTVDEANKAGILIHKINTDDNTIRDQIQMFSLQIAHKRVKFSAAGLFPINYSLLFSIIGGVSTYMVILIQFSTN